MTSRFLPYSTRPGRFAVQLFSDFAVVVWTVLWLLVGLAVYDAIATIADAGRQVESGANGIAGNLASAGHGAQHIPVVGDTVSKPLNSASHAALDIAGAGHDLDTRRAGSRYCSRWLSWRSRSSSRCSHGFFCGFDSFGAS